MSSPVVKASLDHNNDKQTYEQTHEQFQDPKKYPEHNTDNDKHSVDYLPKEQEQDWFEIIDQPIDVKNRHLINIITINTNSGLCSNRPSHDIKGDKPPCPKIITSPWLQSSIEPDKNSKPLE